MVNPDLPPQTPAPPQPLSRAELRQRSLQATPIPQLSPDQAAELDQVIQAFDQFQTDSTYHQAQTTLSQLLTNLDLTPRERSGLEQELAELEGMLDKLEHQVVQIAVFGMVSRGKSSLLNALLGQPQFATGPTHGVTRTSQRAEWLPERFTLPGLGQSRLELLDTPGIDEVAGEAREQIAQQVAKQADLILFVVAGDLTRVEYQALAELRQANKPILLVFNKIDQYPDADRQAIYAKLRDERVKELLSPNEIVMAAAAPFVAQAILRSDGSVGAELQPAPPQITDLKLKILEILEREGKALVALNTLLYANDLNDQVVARKMAIRNHRADKLIWQAVISKALATALNPITVVDVVGSLVVDIALILTLSRLYGIALTQQGALDLLRRMAWAMGGVTVSEMAANLGLSSLKGLLALAAPATGGTSLAPYLPIALTQAGVAGVSTYGIGQISKQYFANGAAWGPEGPKTMVKEILNSLDQTYILHRVKAELLEKLK